MHTLQGFIALVFYKKVVKIYLVSSKQQLVSLWVAGAIEARPCDECQLLCEVQQNQKCRQLEKAL